MLKTGVLQTGKHSIRHIAHTRLQRQQGVGQSAGGHLLLKESDNILGDLARDIIRRTEWPGLVGQVCHNDGGDLIKTALHVCSANAVRYLEKQFVWGTGTYMRSSYEWLLLFRKQYPYLIWLNPETIPEKASYWTQTQVELADIFQMFHLSANGLEAGMKCLLVRQ